MKIKTVKFYQGIKIGSDTHASVSAGQPLRCSSSEKCEGNIQETANGILIKIGNEASLASWNNIQYVVYDLEQPVAIKKDLASALKAQKSN